MGPAGWPGISGVGGTQVIVSHHLHSFCPMNHDEQTGGLCYEMMFPPASVVRNIKAIQGPRNHIALPEHTEEPKELTHLHGQAQVPRLLVRVHQRCRRCRRTGKCSHGEVFMVRSAALNKQMTGKLSRAARTRLVSLCRNLTPDM